IDALSEENTKVYLGSLNLDSVSAVRFAIGVGPDVNNLDPSVYPISHPLAPKFPSMHWGWAAGYRFVCAEGFGGTSFNQTFQLHGLGNSNYAMQTINTRGTTSGNDTLVIDIEADYSNLTKNISVASGTISHGETGDALEALKNLNNHVFQSAEGNTALAFNEKDWTDLRIHPNPSNGEVFFTGMDNADLVIYNALGVVVHKSKLKNLQSIFLKDSGTYLCVVSLNGFIRTSKILVQ
ncbi:MAG: MbnP family protein, partial [Bacteroidota bacterium]|nr:MbnP family protein [Bacteroidota bacterium]